MSNRLLACLACLLAYFLPPRQHSTGNPFQRPTLKDPSPIVLPAMVASSQRGGMAPTHVKKNEKQDCLELLQMPLLLTLPQAASKRKRKSLPPTPGKTPKTPSVS
ncbi:hypothetical protein IWX49DRAFT_552918 [Phyllosticta citricarpa]|uniref:Secreted protein n=1 Tax=Phyllosticta citricarpa TaxID=55181 RepID=A0ABR1L9I2_9PEZI